MFFRLSSWELALLIFAVTGGATAAGYLTGRYLRRHSQTLREPFGVLQAALLGIVGLILAFGLSLALGRYEDRRAAMVDEANAIGTTYLRAQLLSGRSRRASLPVLRSYTELAIEISSEVPGSDAIVRTTAAEEALQRRLWHLDGESVATAPLATAPRVYTESLNTMIDAQATRLASLGNRVPGAVLAIEVICAAAGLGLLALHISILGRGPTGPVAAALLITLLLLVTFDLDRPTRGLITIPATPLTAVRASMSLSPAAAPFSTAR